MSSLTAAWQSIKYFLNNQISVIPIRDKDDEFGVAKSPYGKSWGQWQKRIIEESQLWSDMERFKTEAIGIVTGKVSGNLEGIDLDEKYMPGISANLFKAMQALYPDLWNRLRVHGTPSKGFHLLYRCPDGIDGNMKLAARPATESELSTKPKIKIYNFLETRGEGGYLAGPPSLGYTVIQNVDIPVITGDERAAIISLCKSFTQILPTPIKAYKPTQSQSQYYDTNPFEDFNNRCEPKDLAELCGFTFVRDESPFIWFTRPGGTKNHIHLSFNTEKRFYYCFTGNTELRQGHGYSPANFICTILHESDKKKTYQYLTKEGYGKVKESIEKEKTERAARSKSPVPANFSEEAKRLHNQLVIHLGELHPFGVFWYYNEDENLTISRELLYQAAYGMGFRYHNGNVVRVVGKFIHKIDERQFQDGLKHYINEPDDNERNKISDVYESFMQRSGVFTMQRLPILDTTRILNDTRGICYKFFNNGYLCIDCDAVTFLPYDTLEALVWYEKVQQRQYTEFIGGKYIDFIQKAIVDPLYVKPVIGYLAHEYKDETTGYIIVLTEQCPDPKMGGGSGKNVFCNLLNYTTTYTSKPGVQAKFDEKFFQSWNGQRIFGISDVPKNFDFIFLKEPATGSFIWKKLFKDEIEVKNEDAPKFIVQTNYSYEISDGGLKRRIIPVEFTEFFTKAGGLDVYYGDCHFPRDWSEQDWNGFDTFIAKCVQVWIQDKRKLSAIELTDTGWEKQFSHTYGATAADFIMQNFEIWKTEQFISNEVWSQRLNDYYKENDTKINFHVGSRRLYEAIETYCIKFKWLFVNGHVKRIGAFTTTKGKMFYPDAPF